ncbi:oxidoreductase activity protein [[Candida] boidinii]|nr:oxidoreductase activity protein [[Candida] boidinii]
MSSPIAQSNLFKPIKLGNVELKNRLVLSPTTRLRSNGEMVPTDIMKQFYSARSKNNGGLLITEGVTFDRQYGFYPNSPGIYNDTHFKAWKQIIDEIHKNGSFVSVQLFVYGRGAIIPAVKAVGFDTIYGPSAIPISEEADKEAKEAGITLKALTIEQIEELKKSFVTSAKYAIDAGADFVEIHAANGYLINQFLEPESNQRTDKYGGSIENRARFVLDLVDSALESGIPSSKLGVRISPYSTFQNMKGDDSEISPVASYGYLLSELERLRKNGKPLAYVAFIEPTISGDKDNTLNSYNTSWVDQIWKGALIRGGSYLSNTPDYSNLINTVNSDDRTLIGAGRYYTSNPDLANRLRNSYKLTKYDRPSFYRNDNQGYNTWQVYDENLRDVKLDDEEFAKIVGTPLA